MHLLSCRAGTKKVMEVYGTGHNRFVSIGKVKNMSFFLY